jgi:hypothetical protein
VEVLLVDPTSAAARQRSADLASQNLDIAAGVDRNLALLNKIRLELPRGARQKLLVKLYNSTPTCAYYRVDERTSIAFYALQKPTEQGAHVDVALKSVLGKIVNDHFREIRDHAHSVDFLEYLYGSTAVDGHREQVGWTEAQDRLYLAVGDPKENPVTWLAAPSTAGAVGLAFSGYKRAAADFIVSRVIPWNQDTGLARQTLAKYGVEFEFFFELEPTRVGRRANRRPSGEW